MKNEWWMIIQSSTASVVTGALNHSKYKATKEEPEEAKKGLDK